MGPASFIMVLFGCTQAQDCVPIVTLPAAYQSEAGCLSARADIVAAFTGDYGQVFAECRKQSAPLNHPASAPIRPTA